jgi:hypothetical protein
MRPFSLPILGILLVALLPSVAFAAADIGKVIAVTPGASMLREGKAEDLALHAGIRVQDSIRTDAGGRVKILFNDDSSVSLGPNTTMDMSEYADAGDKSAFSVHMPQGMIRAIAGKIVDQNPSGFAVTSPEATVGIRGTIITMHVQRGQLGRLRTTVFVENTLRRVHVNNEDVPSGSKWVREDGVNRLERITPEDRRLIGKELAFLGGQGSAAAAPEAAETGGRRATDSFGNGQNPLAGESGLKDDAKIAQSLQNTVLQQSAVGQVSGSLTAQTGTTITYGGTFSFDVNLFSGAINNGNINVGSGTLILSDGTGLANASGFTMSASGTSYYLTLTQEPASGYVRGGADWISGSSFPVRYGVTSPSYSESGPGIGTLK